MPTSTYIKKVLDQDNNEILPITVTTAVLNSGDTTTVLENRLQSIESKLVDFNGLRTGLVPVPEGYSDNLGSIYLRGDGQWSVLSDDISSLLEDDYLPITGGTLTGNAPYINGLSSTLPSGVAMDSLLGRGYAASLGMVQDNFLPLSGGAMALNNRGIDMNGSTITGLVEPTGPKEAANKQYVDELCQNNRGWSDDDQIPSAADGSKAVQAVYVLSTNTTAQNTLTFSTPMPANTTCHIFAYCGQKNAFRQESAGTITIPYNKAANGSTAGSFDTIIVDNDVVFHAGTQVAQGSGKSISVATYKVVEISVMYQTIKEGNHTWYRTVIKTAS